MAMGLATTGLTRQIGDFASTLNFERLPQSVVDIVTTAFTDCIGVMLAGRAEATVRVVEAVFLAKAGAGKSSVLLSNRRVDAVTAATINGTAAHVLDYDDVALRGHPSAVLVSAILAEAEELDLGGPEMVAAYAAGYETWAEIGRRLPKPLHVKGFHPTAIFGTLAAAAACANLRQLSPRQAANAVAMAASQASGLTVNFGTDTKSFHVGSAAAAAIVSARLAAAGMMAAPDGLENATGFLAVYGADPQALADPALADPALADPAAGLGTRWRMLESGISIKRYPVCYGIHRIIDAIVELRDAEDFDAADVEVIRLSMGEIQQRMLRVDWPSTPLEAKFSARFCAAAALLRGHVGLAELDHELIHARATQDLMAKVTVETVSEIDPAFSNYAPYDQVRIALRSGARLDSRQVRRCKGHADVPLSAAELRTKFDDCTGQVLPAPARALLFERLQALSDLHSAADLSAIVGSSTLSRRHRAAGQ